MGHRGAAPAPAPVNRSRERCWNRPLLPVVIGVAKDLRIRSPRRSDPPTVPTARFFYCFSSLRLPAINQCRRGLTNPRARVAEWGYALSKKAGECLSHQARRHGLGLRLHHHRRRNGKTIAEHRHPAPRAVDKVTRRNHGAAVADDVADTSSM